MDWTTTLAVIGFVVALVLTPIYLLVLVKGVRSLSGIRNMLTRPPGDYGQASRGRRADGRDIGGR